MSSDLTSKSEGKEGDALGFQLILHKGGDFSRLWREGADQRKAEGSHLLWIFSGPWRRSGDIDPKAITTPFALWDGKNLVSNLPGIGLKRRFGHTTVVFYHSPWQSCEGCAMQSYPRPKAHQPILLVPSYDVGHSRYFDGCVLGFFPAAASAHPSFMLPLGRYSYCGPFAASQAPASQPANSAAVSRQSPLATTVDPLGPLALRAPLVTALGEWLRHRYTPHSIEVLVEAKSHSPKSHSPKSHSPKSQSLCLVYLAMAGYFDEVTVKMQADIEPQLAKGFKALSRNLGFYVGKAQPPPPSSRYEHKRQLALSQLMFLIDPSRKASCTREFNSHSHLIPSSLTAED